MCLLTFSLVDNGNNEAIDTEDTSHDTWDQRLEDEFGSEDTDRADTDTGLSGSVGGSEVSKHEGGG